MRPAPVIAITSGEPSGIGPDLCLCLAGMASRIQPVRLVILGDRDLLAERARLLKYEVSLCAWEPDSSPQSGTLDVVHLPLGTPVRLGEPDPANATYVLHLLDRALAGCLDAEFAAMVTAPVHKAVINAAGIPFTGHTEYLAEKSQTPRVVMMLVGGGLRVALATTHLPLKDVPPALTRSSLEITLRILKSEMATKYGLLAPRILVSGLNPHAGEGGYLGSEEIGIIIPVLELLRAEGMRLEGPLPADTLFTPHVLSRGDCVLAMYHDQGLPVLKYASFGNGVNVTLGLPVIRTSVDHGTALELAGTGRADPGSLFAAVEQAVEMVRRSGRIWSDAS